MKNAYYEKISTTLLNNLQKRNFDAYYVSSKEEALKKALSLVNKDKLITFGGSVTLDQIGLLDHLSSNSYNLLDRRKATSQEEKEEIYRKSFFADTYFMSTNAITIDGELINIDGNGNRVAALIYGPKEVIIITGLNKLVTNVEDGINRVHNIAAPPTTLRLNIDTPCSNVGHCKECLSDKTICNQTVITRNSRHKNRIKVILVGEELGY